MPSKNWRKWTRPWTKEQCRYRYVECGDEVGIRGLADMAGQPKSTVERWCKNANWVEARRHFSDNLEALTQQKTIEKTSEKLSEDLSDIGHANYEVHKLARNLAATVLQIKIRYLKEVILPLPIEQQLEEIKKLEPAGTNYWSQMLARHTQGIESATGFSHFIVADTAGKKLNSLGYLVSDQRAEIQVNEDD